MPICLTSSVDFPRLLPGLLLCVVIAFQPAATRAAGASRFLAQSIAWQLPGAGAKAVAHLERATLDFGGVVLRYGQFYGPGTYHEGEPPEPPRIQIDAAAARTAELLETPSGVVTIVDPDDSA